MALSDMQQKHELEQRLARGEEGKGPAARKPGRPAPKAEPPRRAGRKADESAACMA